MSIVARLLKQAGVLATTALTACESVSRGFCYMFDMLDICEWMLLVLHSSS